MPARNRKAEAATRVWEKRKGKRLNSNRPRKLKTWSNESMLLAINAIRDGTMSINMTARTFDVPPSTLKDRISGRVKHGTKPGPIPYLDEAEEKELVDFLIKSAAMGYGKTKREIFSILERTKASIMTTSTVKAGGFDSCSVTQSCPYGVLILFHV